MKRRVVVICLLGCTVAAALIARRWWPASPRLDALLKNNDLTHTKVTYSRSDFFTLDGGIRNVSAVFQGDGVAVLRLGDRKPIEIKMKPERYRELLQTMADNSFATIAIKRRWGTFIADLGRLEVALAIDGRQTRVYVDGKHYVDAHHRLAAILEKIFSFHREFGQRLDYDTVACTRVPDYRDEAAAITAGAAVVLVFGGALLVWYFRKRRLRPPAAQPPLPDGGPDSGGNSPPPAS